MKMWIVVALGLLLGAVGPISGAPCPEVDATLVTAPDVTTWPPAPYRWRDIATNLYAETYRNTYLYDDAQVVVTYTPCQMLTFAGHLSAVNLKPNFAYQIKLVGKPTGLWGEEGDDATNELIGFIGRWWRTAPNPGNSSDADYIANHEDPDYIFEGYLLLDFFVTDPDGAAEVDFAVDSSFHVLFWEHQRTPGTCDSPVKWSTVTGSADSPAYDADVGPTEVGVYAQIERLCYGETVMTPGVYDCRLLLTEESFHQSGDTEGYWASAMAYDDLSFEVVETLADAAEPPSAVRILGARPNPFNPSTTVRYALARPATVSVDVFDAAGALVRHLLDAAPQPAGEHSVRWRGCDRNDRPVGAGAYLLWIRADGDEATRTVTLVK